MYYLRKNFPQNEVGLLFISSYDKSMIDAAKRKFRRRPAKHY
jgi:hypothetical protein